MSVCVCESVPRGRGEQLVLPFWLRRPSNMNLFCFTLEGSTESIYEPAYSQTLKEVLPRYQSSPALLRHKPEWTGSDPAISSMAESEFGIDNMKVWIRPFFASTAQAGGVTDRPQSTVKVKRINRRSFVPTSHQENEVLEKCKTQSQSSTLTRNGSMKDLKADRSQNHLHTQSVGTPADSAEPVSTTGRIKKLQSLVHTKKGQQSSAGKGKSFTDSHDHLDVFSNNNPVLTCIGLGRRTEKTQSKTLSSPQHQQQKSRDAPADLKEEGVWWSPFECPQPWSPFYHTCQQRQHELWVCGGALSLPWASEWDRFESLIQELDRKQPDLCPPPVTVPSITELQFSQNILDRFGRCEASEPPPSTKPQDEVNREQKKDTEKVWLERKEMQTSLQNEKGNAQVSPIKDGNTPKDEEKRKGGGGEAFLKAHRRSGDSLESLYSLNSGQSSSSGVISGSGWSSNRDSLRLDDDLLSTRQFCGRARVHTDFVPSPYDTESLKLKVGDVIDIFSKPPMGIWTGMLNGKIGNFKFIYVDVLNEESPDLHEETQNHKVNQKSPVKEVLRRLSLEEYASSLQLNGYQTVDDLMKLKEGDLMELNVTDPEHRHRLLTAVDSLQQMHSDWQTKSEANQEAETPGENMKAEVSGSPRDSGCHMSPDSSDNSSEDAHLHFYLQYNQPAETAAS